MPTITYTLEPDCMLPNTWYIYEHYGNKSEFLAMVRGYIRAKEYLKFLEENN